jgi:hypothetical protein
MQTKKSLIGSSQVIKTPLSVSVDSIKTIAPKKEKKKVYFFQKK